MRTTFDKQVSCMICEKEFSVRIRKSDRMIISKCYHSYMPKHIFLGWTYELDFNATTLKAKKVHFKNKFWRFIGYTNLQRAVFYFFWGLFYGWQKIEYWECKKCCEGD
ncbi:hypothetical protein [Oceanihabitans sediminis]|uniref:hypothetical protein n=1 Tax=Oceanihabitans sediminis TaxID=1812012 RepID=UPI00299EAD48|nr:hypothetical protein [Oceanihabitans sediminis]MDX1279441.1 hypothetical protein [Oceanihabitans sediminis]